MNTATAPDIETKTETETDTARKLPLAGLRVVEFTHRVMGPT